MTDDPSNQGASSQAGTRLSRRHLCFTALLKWIRSPGGQAGWMSGAHVASNGFSTSTSSPATSEPFSRHQRQAVGLGRRRQQRVDDRHRTDRVHPAPFLRDGSVYGQNPVAEASNHVAEPRLERLGFPGIAAARHLHALADFAQFAVQECAYCKGWTDAVDAPGPEKGRRRDTAARPGQAIDEN